MKFWLKSYLIYMALFIAAITIAGILMAENQYSTTLNHEIRRTIEEEKNIYKAIQIKIYPFIDIPMTNQKELEKIINEKYSMDLYSKVYKDMVNSFTGDEAYYKIIWDNRSFQNKEIRIDIGNLVNAAYLSDKTVFTILNNQNNRYLAAAIKLETDAVFTIIRNVGYIDKQRIKQYIFLAKMEIALVLLLGILTFFISKYITNPIEKLTESAKEIASGSYNKRVSILTNDEIGTLSIQFNKMADRIENDIYTLQRMSESKQQFIDNLMHEIKTPMTSIIGYSEFLRNNKCEEEVYYKSIGFINSEGKRILNMANKLLDIIFIRENSVNKIEYNSKELYEEVYLLFNFKLIEKNIEFKYSGIEKNIIIDKDLIKTVVINLVDNAIKASDEKSIIEFGLKNTEGQDILFVKDEGKGILGSDIENILEPFYRVDKSRSRKEGGAGLGLSICNEVINIHGSKLIINSKIGKGTEIEIVL